MKKIVFYSVLLLLTGCSFNNTITGFSQSLLNQNDPELVDDGLPTLLLILDGLLESDPKNVDLLLSSAKLYSAYASTFVDDTHRAAKMATHARSYAQRALCLKLKDLCLSLVRPLDDFNRSLDAVSDKHIDLLYNFNVAWATWIQLNSNDWGAIADLPKAEAIFRKIAQWDERYDNGSVQLYLGVLTSQLPINLGGKPEQGRAHFEKAIAYSEGKNLMAKVLFAEHYARLVFNKTLHDRLLNEVMAANSETPGFTLINTLAQKKALDLLNTSDDYF